MRHRCAASGQRWQATQLECREGVRVVVLPFRAIQSLDLLLLFDFRRFSLRLFQPWSRQWFEFSSVVVVVVGAIDVRCWVTLSSPRQ